jgi:hypothetical protein
VRVPAAPRAGASFGAWVALPVLTARRIGWRRIANNLATQRAGARVREPPRTVDAPGLEAGDARRRLLDPRLRQVRLPPMAHRIPFLWRFHVVHHLDEQLDMSTNDRAHLLDNFFRNVLRVAFMMVFAVPLASLAVAELISTAAGLFHHKASLRVPRWITSTLGRVVTMPGFDAVHHSRYQPYTDSNYSITLCFWDALLGTRSVREPLPGMRPGLDDVRDPNLATLVVGPLLPSFDVHAAGYSARNVVGTSMRS